MSKRLLTGLALAMAAALALAGSVQAQNFPDRTIQLISPYAPGGGTDTLARLVAQKLTESLGQSVIVINRPGAGGTVGTAQVAKMPADGYTIMIASPSPIVIAPHGSRPLSYDPLKDLAPIIGIASSPAVMVVPANSPARSVKEFIELAKSKSGQLAYSSSGNGGTGHLAGALFEARTGTKMIHVPYKSGGEAMTALVAGDVQLIFTEPLSLVPQLKTGRVRPLAVTAIATVPMFPELPTLASTIPGFQAGPWFGLLAPAGTPPAIIAKLNTEVNKILRAPDVKETIKTLGADPLGGSPGEFATLIKEEYERWGTLIRQINLKVE